MWITRWIVASSLWIKKKQQLYGVKVDDQGRQSNNKCGYFLSSDACKDMDAWHFDRGSAVTFHITCVILNIRMHVTQSLWCFIPEKRTFDYFMWHIGIILFPSCSESHLTPFVVYFNRNSTKPDSSYWNHWNLSICKWIGILSETRIIEYAMAGSLKVKASKRVEFRECPL